MNIYFAAEQENLSICVETGQRVDKPVLVFSNTMSNAATAACMRDYLQGQLDKNMRKLREKMTEQGFKLAKAKRKKPTEFSENFEVAPDGNKECW